MVIDMSLHATLAAPEQQIARSKKVKDVKGK